MIIYIYKHITLFIHILYYIILYIYDYDILWVFAASRGAFCWGPRSPVAARQTAWSGRRVSAAAATTWRWWRRGGGGDVEGWRGRGNQYMV